MSSCLSSVYSHMKGGQLCDIQNGCSLFVFVLFPFFGLSCCPGCSFLGLQYLALCSVINESNCLVG